MDIEKLSAYISVEIHIYNSTVNTSWGCVSQQYEEGSQRLIFLDDDTTSTKVKVPRAAIRRTLIGNFLTISLKLSLSGTDQALA